MKLIATTLATVLFGIFGTPPVTIIDPVLQERINLILAENPGSAQTAMNEVTMDGGDPVLTLEFSTASFPAGAKAVASCPTNRFCAYSKAGYKGDVITYSTCTNNHSVTGLATVRSIANSRTSGVVRAYKNSILLGTAVAGTGTNISTGTTKLSCT